MHAKDPETHSLVTPQELKLVNIVQNEVGQSMACDLLEKESHACGGPVLERIKTVSEAHGIIPRVTRDKNIIKVLGPHYKPKQDPFHLFQRINEKISGKGVTSSISNKLREALYYTEGELKEHTQAAKDFKAACNTVVRADLNQGSDARKEWQGSVKNKTFLIANGFVSMDSRNNFHYKQDTQWKLLHSSGVESTNNLLSQLSKRKMGPKSAVRILYCFVVALVSRIPNLYQMDILALLKLPLLTNNLLAPTPQLDFALTILNKLKETGEATRSKDPATILVSDRNFPYGVAQPRQSNENGVQTEQPAGPQTIQTFFHARNSTKAGPREVNAKKHNAVRSQRNIPTEEGEKFQITTCPIATFILYNAAVAHLIHKNKPSPAEEDWLEAPESSIPVVQLQRLPKQRSEDEYLAVFEKGVTQKLFDTLAATKLTWKQERFCQLTHLTAMLTDKLSHRTQEVIDRQFDALRKKAKRDASC
ncbi:hypothetical protein DFS34DRAFT_668880 [Phlyctochytrium arcticum]|nr:hypothetical protein DFS34DRAFT_668880 [Phlyctochytrium arcticum]